MWKGWAGPPFGVSLNRFHSSVAPSFMYWSISCLNCLPLIVCVGGALGNSDEGVGVGDGGIDGVGVGVGLRPPVLPCGVGVGRGPGSCVLVVLKRISRVTMPTGGTMSARKS